MQELRAVQSVCEALEQTVARLKQRLRAEEVKGMSEGTLQMQLAASQDEVKVIAHYPHVLLQKYCDLTPCSSVPCFS